MLKMGCILSTERGLIDLNGVKLFVQAAEGGSISEAARGTGIPLPTLTTPRDLRRVPCACWRSPGASIWNLGDHEVELEPVLVTNDYGHLLRLAGAGDVVTDCPREPASSVRHKMAEEVATAREEVVDGRIV